MSENEQDNWCRGCDPLLDSIQTAALLGIDEMTLQRMARRKELPAIKVGRLWRFRADEIDAWIRSRFAAVKQRNR